MSYLIAEPRIVAAAAAEVAGIGSAVSTAGAAAAGPTCALPRRPAMRCRPPSRNRSAHTARNTRPCSLKSRRFTVRFHQTLAAAANSYADAEAAIASTRQNQLAVPAAAPTPRRPR